MKFRDKPIIVIIVDESEPPTILCGKKYYRMKDMMEYDAMFRELRRALSRGEENGEKSSSSVSQNNASGKF